MTDVRTFRAATMQQALDLVREELGGDAVVLHTRQVVRKRLLPWSKPIEEVEITASKTINAPSPPASTRAKRGSSRPAAAVTTSASYSAAPRSPSKHLDLVSDSSESVADLLGHVERTLTNRRTPAATSLAPAGASRTTRRPAAAPRADVRTNRFTNRPLGAPATMLDEFDPTAALAQRLDVIQKMLHDLGRGGVSARNEDVPNDLFDLYTELIDAELEDVVARDLVVKLKRTASRKQLADHDAARALLTAMVESEIRCCEPIAPRPGRRKVVALVGATGVGKTTTIAKLAANFRLRSGVKMGLVTVDSYRVAAVEQLRTYAEIIDLPMKVVANPLEMRRALEELAGLDLVLIDTAGRSPKDDLQIKELKSLLAEAHVDEVHLVLSMTSSLRSLEAAAGKFAPAGTTALILTKLDEASGMGALLSVSRKIDLPISYLTVGQDVPDDIEPAHPARIARLILGQERAGT